ARRKWIERHNVQRRDDQQTQFFARMNELSPSQRGGSGSSHHRSESPKRLERETLQRGPERGGGSACARTLEADLTEMQVGRGEIGVRRIMDVETTNRCVPKEHGTATVRLKPVFVRINHDAVTAGDLTQRRAVGDVEAVAT